MIWIFPNKLSFKETNESILLGRLIKELVFNQKKKKKKVKEPFKSNHTHPPPFILEKYSAKHPTYDYYIRKYILLSILRKKN